MGMGPITYGRDTDREGKFFFKQIHEKMTLRINKRNDNNEICQSTT